MNPIQLFFAKYNSLGQILMEIKFENEHRMLEETGLI